MPQPDITLVPILRGVDTAVFVDARQDTDDAPVKVERIETRCGSLAIGHTSHTMGIAALTHIVQAWYGRCPDCYLVMPRGVDFSIGAPISRAGRRNAAQAVAVIARMVTAP